MLIHLLGTIERGVKVAKQISLRGTRAKSEGFVARVFIPLGFTPLEIQRLRSADRLDFQGLNH